VFNSEVREIREHSIVLTTPRGDVELPNDYVFIFAGGELPFDFLGRIGIMMQQQKLS
jgi:thioredoxin reductase (NADPH)